MSKSTPSPQRVQRFINKRFSSIKRIKRYLRKHHIKGLDLSVNNCPLGMALRHKFGIEFEVWVGFARLLSGLDVFGLPEAADTFQDKLLKGYYSKFLRKSAYTN